MEAHRQGLDSAVEIEVRGLSIYTHHGVTEAEREVGQRLEIDVSFDVPDCDAVLTDRLEDTADYADSITAPRCRSKLCTAHSALHQRLLGCNRGLDARSYHPRPPPYG